MNIVIISSFRNASGHITRWYDQCSELAIHASKSNTRYEYNVVRAIAVEGDSTDGSYHKLTGLPIGKMSELSVIKHDHGQRVFSSTEDKDRLSALTGVMLAGMSQVRESDDVVLYVESDLIWTPHNVGSIIDLAYREEIGFDIVAPLIFAGDLFYDIWAFRKGNERFSPLYPYHRDLAYSGVMEVDSIGSCFACRGEVIQHTIKHLKGEEGLVSFCNSARELGYRIGVDARFRVEHP